METDKHPFESFLNLFASVYLNIFTFAIHKPTPMLLFTWTGLMTKTGHLFEWTFRLMEGPNRTMNVMFIIIGIIGATYWLSQQYKYNQKAEQEGTIK